MLAQTSIKSGQLNSTLGNVVTYERTKYGIEGITSNHARFRVTVFTDHIIKIHITKEDGFDEQSYAVIQQPQNVAFDFDETEETIIISTEACRLILQKSSTTFSFFTTDDHPILEDDAAFGTSWIGEQITTYKKLQPEERFIGLGEKTGPLNRRGHGYQNWNTDHFGYPPDSDPLYCSTPFYMGVHSGLSYGVFLDNSHKTHFNFGASNRRFSSFSADQGDMSYYFIHHTEVEDIISSYTYLTGTMEMPPIWSLGYQQCRYSYRPDKEVLGVANTFRDKDIPADVIVLDIHYMEKYKIFTWDKKDFPDPAGLIKKLEEQGFKVVVIFDPGIKIQENYAAYQSGLDHDIFVKYPDGTNYEGEVWPGWCHFPDFTNPKTRTWWQEQMKCFSELGIEGFWNDMNEIATWGQTLPELMEFDFEGKKTSTRQARNVYGMQMARSTYEGAKKNMPGKRPFNLTRAGFSGVQRYAAVWTGDNVADDEHMLLGVRLVNSLGLTGIPFSGYDVGGFAGNADEQLFARWISIGAFSPFFRGHSMINSKDSEPWAYGEEVEEISRNYIKLRYKLMPYIYSAFHQASTKGTPVSRSLAMNYTHDDLVYNEEYHNEYLFGDSILVAPVPSKISLARVYLPEGEWYDLYTDQKHKGSQQIITDCPIEKLPAYVKAGAIIAMQDSIDTLSNNTNTELQIHVYQGGSGTSYSYYEDDGTSYGYTSGEYYKREILYLPEHETIDIHKAEGDYSSQFNQLKVYLHGFVGLGKEVKVNGCTIEVKNEDFRHVEPISDFDPFNDPKKPTLVSDLPYILIENNNDAIKISW